MKIKNFDISNKKLALIGAILAIVVISGFMVKANSGPKFQTAPVTKRTITQIVEASGTINPVNTVSVGSTVSGLISAIYVDFNSVVKKGQLLAEIDPRTFQATVDQNRAAMNNAEAALAEVQATLEMSTKTYNRYKNLYSRNFIPKSELDQAESDYKAGLAKVNAAKFKIQQARAQYEQSVVNLNYTKVIAPVDGMIISREIDLGQPVAATLQAPELFTIAQDLEEMQIEVNVSEADIGEVKEGQDVMYTLDGYPNSTFYGKVTQVRISPTTVSNVVTYSVIVKVDNAELKLKPGMTANVSIITSEVKDALCVPNRALKFSPPDNTQRYEQQGLWIVEKGKARRVNIKTGASDDNYTQVISDEITEGTRVATGTTNSKTKQTTRRMRPPM